MKYKCTECQKLVGTIYEHKPIGWLCEKCNDKYFDECNEEDKD